MTEELVLTFLRTHSNLLNIKGVAESAGMKFRTLHDYVNGSRGKRGLSPETVAALTTALEVLRLPWPAPGA